MINNNTGIVAYELKCGKFKFPSDTPTFAIEWEVQSCLSCYFEIISYEFIHHTLLFTKFQKNNSKGRSEAPCLIPVV